MSNLIISLTTINIITIVIACVVVLIPVLIFLVGYKKCPKGKALVIYGAKLGYNDDGTPKQSKIVRGGAAFVLPIFQSYQYLDLTPFSLNVESKNIITNKDERVNVLCDFKFAVSQKDEFIQNAAERLLGSPLDEIKDMAEDFAKGAINTLISKWDSENIEKDKYKVFDQIVENLSNTLKMVGLEIKRANLTDLYTVKNN